MRTVIVGGNARAVGKRRGGRSRGDSLLGVFAPIWHDIRKSQNHLLGGSARQNVAPMNKNRIGGTEIEMRRPTALKFDTYTDGLYVYAAVISVEVRVHYPGRSAMPRESATATERWREGIAEVSRGIVKAWRQAEGPKVK
jgi:hypothetical protein